MIVLHAWKIALPEPCTVAHIEPEPELAGVITVAPHAPRRFGQQQAGTGLRVFGIAPVGRQDAAMAEHAARRRHGVNVVAVQRVPHALAVHVAPQRAQMLGLRVPEIADRM